jgi:hypothetical protein
LDYPSGCIKCKSKHSIIVTKKGIDWLCKQHWQNMLALKLLLKASFGDNEVYSPRKIATMKTTVIAFFGESCSIY